MSNREFIYVKGLQIFTNGFVTCVFLINGSLYERNANMYNYCKQIGVKLWGFHFILFPRFSAK